MIRFGLTGFGHDRINFFPRRAFLTNKMPDAPSAIDRAPGDVVGVNLDFEPGWKF